jgi:hypothetical protein
MELNANIIKIIQFVRFVKGDIYVFIIAHDLDVNFVKVLRFALMIECDLHAKIVRVRGYVSTIK